MSSKGPVLTLLLVAIIVAFKLSGIHLMDENIKRMGPWMVTRFGSFVIVHSHHIKKLRENGKEFKLKNKYFCTGCYGMFLGTIISICLIILYLINGYNAEIVFPLISLTIILFIPIILRYSLFLRMSSLIRFLSNVFLPLGLVILLCVVDYLYQNWIINSVYELALIGISFLRWKIAEIDDRRLMKRIEG